MNNNDNELVQYYIINKDLKMSLGKSIAQACHVATMIVVESSNDKFNYWYNNDQKKIILEGHQKDLEKLVEQGFYYIRDNGLTEIPKDSLTCVGLGVMTRAEAKLYIKRLQLMKG